MKNKTVGMLIVGIAIVIGFIIYIFNQALTSIVSTGCTHGLYCPMWGTIEFQTNVSIGLMIFVAAIGIYLIFFAEKQIITKIKRVSQKEGMKRITKKSYEDILDKLDGNERSVLETIIKAKGSIYQSDLVKNTNFPKVKVTRILDSLEGKSIIERKRRGMTNIVILKH